MTHRVLFIGAGRMAQAMIAGMVQTKSPTDWQITVANKSDTAKLNRLSEKYGVHTTAEWQTAVANVDAIVLAIPPEYHPPLLKTLSPLITTNQLVMSVAAGIGTSGLEQGLPNGTPVAWLMPNTASELGESMTLVAYGASVKPAHRAIVEQIVQGLGQYFVGTEEQVHHLTAITGSALAFVFQVANALENMAVHYGVPEEQARTLVGQMILGSGKLLQTGAAPLELADAVTTPGGATAAGRKVLDAGNFTSLVEQAVVATNKRAKELGASHTD